MTDEEIPSSEEIVEEDIQQEEVPEIVERTVPLAALEAERRKRQDLEAQNRTLQDLMSKSKAQEPEDEEDDEEFITKAELKKRLGKATFEQKREILEEAFISSRPDAIELLNKHWTNIIEKKPWLKNALDSAPNRFERAYEIVCDYMPKDEETSAQKFGSPKADAKRIVANSQKPGNPATIAKTPNLNSADYLKSIAGKPEFREYRKKMMSGG